MLSAEVAFAHGLPFVQVSSKAVYGRCQAESLTEDLPPMPETAYGRSKAAAESELTSWASRGLRLAIVRVAAVYGPAPPIRPTLANQRFARLLAGPLDSGKRLEIVRRAGRERRGVRLYR